MDKSNKKTGSFYTPESLIKYMTQYVEERKIPQSILEPSAGDGRFVRFLREFNCSIDLVELDPIKVENLKNNFSNQCDIHCDDFLNFSLLTEKKYDLIIGNPPYISKKNVEENQRITSIQLIDHFNLSEDLFQNIWVSFILAAVKLLNDNGVIFFVLPFEFLQVQYAEKLRGFLETEFNNIEITTFEERIFTNIEQDVCLVYLSNEKKENAYIKYTTLLNASNRKTTFQSIIMRNKPLKKWSNCILDDNETDNLMHLSENFPRVRDFGESSPGIVTGANSFFVLTKTDVEKMKIPEKLILPVLTKGSSIPPMFYFKNEDFTNIAVKDGRNYLLYLTGTKQNEFCWKLNNYLHKGKLEKIDKQYKCKNRHRWYDVPIIKTGTVSFFKRYHELPKLIVNVMEIHTTDVAYNIRFKQEYHPASFAFCFYNSLTLALCEYYGRFYGGGVAELVPKEFKSLNVPYMKISDKHLNHLDDMFRRKESLIDIINYVDAVVLTKLSEQDIKLLQDIRNRYLKRRMKLYGHSPKAMKIESTNNFNS